jgi:hypothetical protein
MVATEYTGLTGLALIRRPEPDGTVAVSVVVLVHECTGPAADLFLAAEGPPVDLRYSPAVRRVHPPAGTSLDGLAERMH